MRKTLGWSVPAPASTSAVYTVAVGFDHFTFGDHKELEKAITKKTAAIMVETIMGEGGIKPIPIKCLKYLRNIEKLT